MTFHYATLRLNQSHPSILDQTLQIVSFHQWLDRVDIIPPCHCPVIRHYGHIVATSLPSHLVSLELLNTHRDDAYVRSANCVSKCPLRQWDVQVLQLRLRQSLGRGLVGALHLLALEEPSRVYHKLY
ncbi:granule-bound starch synthase 2, chloroplastic/amyloplastic [Dorcoceras hygrometricum]|uniref:Granule-bound starch synthase 2, chloroplastic/amyloplastic n=1 Tax=Dorcoceras hygrometricum TaxID=472368 RepID=A0A2Z7AA68_9LAMI|nr:granule-bound starch synthase 2, chloroplastic/amyloplastic [Dorcoceras hygrometricum]